MSESRSRYSGKHCSTCVNLLGYFVRPMDEMVRKCLMSDCNFTPCIYHSECNYQWVIVNMFSDYIFNVETEQAVAECDRQTTPYMTKYERARVLGTRALQIRCVSTLDVV